eukprot:6205000-Prymnesium_polylepis.1
MPENRSAANTIRHPCSCPRVPDPPTLARASAPQKAAPAPSVPTLARSPAPSKAIAVPIASGPQPIPFAEQQWRPESSPEAVLAA